MKKILLSVSALALLVASCGKDDDNNNNLPSNGWRLNSTQYNTNQSNLFGNAYTFTSTTPAGGLVLTFAGSPTAGTYRIVESSPATTEVAVAVTGSTSYLASEYSTTSATVTVNGGKITVSFPDTWVKTFAGTDSVKLSANVTQL